LICSALSNVIFGALYHSRKRWLPSIRGSSKNFLGEKYNTCMSFCEYISVENFQGHSSTFLHNLNHFLPKMSKNGQNTISSLNSKIGPLTKNRLNNKNKNKKQKKKKHFRVNLNFLYNILILSVFMWSINYVWLNPPDNRNFFSQQTNTFFLLNASREQTIFDNKSFNELGKVLSNDIQFVGFLCNTVILLHTGPYFPIGTLGTCLGRKDFRGGKFLKLTLYILSCTRSNKKDILMMK
jgi:hypothetical protein